MVSDYLSHMGVSADIPFKLYTVFRQILARCLVIDRRIIQTRLCKSLKDIKALWEDLCGLKHVQSGRDK